MGANTERDMNTAQPVGIYTQHTHIQSTHTHTYRARHKGGAIGGNLDTTHDNSATNISVGILTSWSPTTPT